MEEKDEGCANQNRRYAHNSCFCNTFEHLGARKQIDISHFDGFNYPDKVQEWLGIIENYFQFTSIPKNEQVQIIFLS